MTPRDFVYWLQGFFELRPDDADEITKDQEKIIRQHLALVFKAETESGKKAQEGASPPPPLPSQPWSWPPPLPAGPDKYVQPRPWDSMRIVCSTQQPLCSYSDVAGSC